MDKGPEFRIVGNASEEKKEEAKKELEKALFDHFASLSLGEVERLKKLEYPKSEKEIALIDFANNETNELMRKFGLEPYSIPRENYHLIPPEFYKESSPEYTNAATFYTKQGILFNAEHFRSNPVNFGIVALHETLHLKSHLTQEMKESGEETPFRRGVAILSAQKSTPRGEQHRHFTGLNEAIVSAQEKKSFSKMLELPILKKEKEWSMSREAKKIVEGIREKKEDVPKDEFIWVEGEESEGWGEKNKKNNYRWERFPYYSQRQVLDYVCQEIQRQFSNRYGTPDDVFNEFLRAHFTGRLLPITRLVEKTFGEGSFRVLGNMTIEKESGLLHLETFRKLRLKTLKNGK